MNWSVSFRADQRANEIAKRHYTCQSPDSDQFVPPGRCLVLLSRRRGLALWVTSWPLAEYVKHAWPGAWMCSLFRNEGRVLSSVLIRQAVAATRWHYGAPPDQGMVTFIDPSRVRAKGEMGKCFVAAGFVPCDPPTTKGGLLALQMWPQSMPEPEPALSAQLRMVA